MQVKWLEENRTDLFKGLFVTVKCPNCNYGMDVELKSVRLQSTVFCPCCKTAVHLMDANASVHGSQELMKSELEDLQHEIEEVNETLRFGI